MNKEKCDNRKIATVISSIVFFSILSAISIFPVEKQKYDSGLIYFEKKKNGLQELLYKTASPNRQIRIAYNASEYILSKDREWIIFSTYASTGDLVQAYSTKLKRGFIIASGRYDYNLSPDGKYLLYYPVTPVHIESLPVYRSIPFDIPKEMGIKPVFLPKGEHFIINKWLPDSSGIIQFSFTRYKDKTHKITRRMLDKENLRFGRKDELFSSKFGFVGNIEIDNAGNLYFFAPNKDKKFNLYELSISNLDLKNIVKTNFKRAPTIFTDKDVGDIYFMNPEKKSCVSKFRQSDGKFFPCITKDRKSVV